MLRDPLKLSDQAIVVPTSIAPLLFLLNGDLDKQAIRLLLASEFGVSIEIEVLDQFLNLLDEMLLLDNERSFQVENELLYQYRKLPFRPPALADVSYPADQAGLNRMLQDYLEEVEEAPILEDGKGVLSPHIDYARGGLTYAKVWKGAIELAKSADLVVILGTDHYGGEQPITLTRQNYATPFGILPTDQEIVTLLAKTVGEEDAFRGEIYHRSEHSIELVSNWLHHVRDKKPCSLVPILCGTLVDHLYGGIPIEDNLLLNKLVKVIQEETEERDVLFVISGDLSHVGQAFGGAPLDKKDAGVIQSEDAILLEQISSGDYDQFFNSIRAMKDKNNICGTTPIYLAMRMMGSVKGEVLGYQQCPADHMGTSLVSVCGMVFK